MEIYTDGGCSGNPGPGGWAYVLVEKTDEGAVVLAEASGPEADTTNNRMELTAVIAALRAAKAMRCASAVVFTDSQYVQKGITEWIHAWKRNAWRTSGKQPVKNQDLWIELDSLAAETAPVWRWIKGHAGNVYNERCDALTQEAIGRLKNS